ncbi:MAG: NAD(P)-binding domain-containing protein [Pseudonocardiaceae bacterium]
MSAKLAPAVGSIGVVGTGAVGQAVATTLVATGFCEQLMIVSRTLEQATSMAADLDDMRLALGSLRVHVQSRWLSFRTAR